MEDLQKRSEFWSQAYTKLQNTQNNTTSYLDTQLELFEDEKVLEIGPGGGRQYVKVGQLTEDYFIADISQAVLDLPIYNNVKGKYLIDYKTELEEKFDIIHFWYVLHHFKLDEIDMFFRYLHAALNKHGLIIFNMPKIEKYKPASIFQNNGMGTSKISRVNILDSIVDLFKIVDERTINIESEWHQINFKMVKISKKK